MEEAKKKAHKIWSENLKGRKNLEDIGVDAKVILK
jgi:hypothetical protein